jgi:hypothetical protein
MATDDHEIVVIDSDGEDNVENASTENKEQPVAEAVSYI